MSLRHQQLESNQVASDDGLTHLVSMDIRLGIMHAVDCLLIFSMEGHHRLFMLSRTVQGESQSARQTHV